MYALPPRPPNPRKHLPNSGGTYQQTEAERTTEEKEVEPPAGLLHQHHLPTDRRALILRTNTSTIYWLYKISGLHTVHSLTHSFPPLLYVFEFSFIV